MRDVLYVGTSRKVDLHVILRDAYECLASLGIGLMVDAVPVQIENGEETEHDGRVFELHSYIKLKLKGTSSFIGLTQFETEIVPEFTAITEPLTIGVDVSAGSEMVHRAFGACVAAAIASSAGSLVYDFERIWSDCEATTPDIFTKNVKEKYLTAKGENQSR